MVTTKSTNGEATLALSAIQKLTAGVLASILCGIFWMSWGSKADIAVLQIRIEYLTQTIEGQMNDRYRATQARSDFALRDSAIAEIVRRVEKLEGR